MGWDVAFIGNSSVFSRGYEIITSKNFDVSIEGFKTPFDFIEFMNECCLLPSNVVIGPFVPCYGLQENQNMIYNYLRRIEELKQFGVAGYKVISDERVDLRVLAIGSDFHFCPDAADLVERVESFEPWREALFNFIQDVARKKNKKDN